MSASAFRQAVADARPGVRQLTNIELKALAVATLAEMARREGTDYAATWAADQSIRLRSLNGATAA